MLFVFSLAGSYFSSDFFTLPANKPLNGLIAIEVDAPLWDSFHHVGNQALVKPANSFLFAHSDNNIEDIGVLGRNPVVEVLVLLDAGADGREGIGEQDCYHLRK